MDLQRLHKIIFGASILIIFMVAAYNITKTVKDQAESGTFNKALRESNIMNMGRTSKGLTISDLRDEEQEYFRSYGEDKYEIMKLAAEMYGENATEDEIIDYLEKIDKADKEGRQAVYKMSTERHYDEAKAIIEKRKQKGKVTE